MSERTRAFLLEVLADDLNLDLTEAQLRDELPLGSAGLGMESLNFVELAMQAERRLGVPVPDSDLDRIASFTVGELIEHLDQRLRERENV
jgi:acyl carrier protein